MDIFYFRHNFQNKKQRLNFSLLPLPCFVGKIRFYTKRPCKLLFLFQIQLPLQGKSTSFRLISASPRKNIKNNLIKSFLKSWAAIIFPDLSNLMSYEIVYFWIEHYQIGLINPIVLILSERYFQLDVISFRNGLISHCFFGLYNRIPLSILANFTWANVNYNLCACKGKFLFL